MIRLHIPPQKQTPLAAVGRLFAAAVRLPFPKKPTGGNVVEDPAQTTGAGLVSDFALDKLAAMMTRIPDPDAVLKQLGMQRHDLKRLEFDDEIAGSLDTRREAAITTNWKLESESESDEKEFVEAEVKRVFDTMMRGFWNAVPYGYSVSEAIYANRDEGRIGIERVSVKPMQWFEPLRDGRLVFMQPGTGQRLECDQKRKFCLVRRNATYEQPFGEALLSRLYWPWYFRHNGTRAWMQFVDRFGDPFVVGKSGNPKTMVEALLGMGLKNVIGVGTDDELDVLMQEGDGVFDRLDSRLAERIAKLILGQTLTSGTQRQGGGSFALGQVHEQVRQDKRLADCRMLQEGGQWLVNALWDLNSFAGKPPTFVFADPKDIALERADRDVSLKAGGIVGGFSEDYIERAYGFEKGDFTMPDPNAAPPADPNAPKQPAQGPSAKGKARAAGKKTLAERVVAMLTFADTHTPRARGRKDFTPAQRAIENLGDDVMDDAPDSPISKEDMRAAILGAKDQADLEERLAALISKQDPRFAEAVAQAMFAADVLGFIHSEEGD